MIEAPAAPGRPEETGLEPDFLQKLVAKTFHVHGTMTPSAIARETCLPINVVSALLSDLQRLQIIEARGLAGADMSSELRYALGGRGIPFALEAMAQSQYVGPAPVSLDAFHTQIKRQTIAHERVERADLLRSMSHLVLPEDLIDRLGPAINSARSILFYGDPGNGKTSIAEAVGTAFKDTIYIPYAIEVGGQVISFYDTTVHTRVDPPQGSATGAVSSHRPAFDARWVPCVRPAILTGGELSLAMLDLAYNPVSNFYEAPIHLKAAGGIFIVDDFGRQQTPPQTVLNRWIIPLERKYDYLTLHTGKKFSVPFDQLVVFSTNIEPHKLADTAGLRRLYYKIHIPTPTADDYRQIFVNACQDIGVPFDETVFEEFFRRYYLDRNVAPAGHHPKYILDFIHSVCSYRGEPARLSAPLLDGAWNNLHVMQEPAG
ncbi:AAA family ATPase [Roseibium sp.]|uniref:AAA family ATPase n=1 Tax=Roseibium sp. TaxID=1936156 RepID=UPI003D0EAEFD